MSKDAHTLVVETSGVPRARGVWKTGHLTDWLGKTSSRGAARAKVCRVPRPLHGRVCCGRKLGDSTGHTDVPWRVGFEVQRGGSWLCSALAS